MPIITEDVAQGGVVTEEQVIARARYLDLVYTQSGTLYEKIPDLPRPSQTNSALIGSHVSDGVIGSVSQKSKIKKKNPKETQILALPDSPEEDPSLEISSEINVVDSSPGKKQAIWR